LKVFSTLAQAEFSWVLRINLSYSALPLINTLFNVRPW